MKKVKIAIWSLIVFLIIVVTYQNREFFFAKQSLTLNLLFGSINTPDFYSIYLHIFCFFIGAALVGYFLLIMHLNSKKKLKTLEAESNSHLEKISLLESELASSYKSKSSGYEEKTVVMDPGTIPEKSNNQEEKKSE